MKIHLTKLLPLLVLLGCRPTMPIETRKAMTAKPVIPDAPSWLIYSQPPAEFRCPVPTPVAVWPWAESNYSSYDERTITGLLAWRSVTDTAIVSTIQGRAPLYAKLRARVPGMRIIPGLKTRELLPRFDSVEGWRAVAEQVAAFAAASGESVVLLENETAMQLYLRGTESFDAKRFEEGIRQLPSGVTYVWYPMFRSSTPARWARYEAVCRIVSKVCDVQYTDRSVQTLEALQDEWRQEASKLMAELSGRPTLPMMYNYLPGAAYITWPDDCLGIGLSYVAAHWGDGTPAIVYPGLARWPASAALVDVVANHRRADAIAWRQVQWRYFVADRLQRHAR